MPIRTSITATGNFSDATVRLNSQLTQGYREAVETAYETTEADLRQDFKKTPGVSKHPFKWSTNKAADDKARRWWFWAIRNGLVKTNGTRYVRTGKLARSFITRLLLDGPNATIRVSSNAGDKRSRFKYRFTVGTFDKRRNFQITGHKRTGWWLIRDVTNRRFEQFEDKLLATFTQVDKKFTRSR